MTRVLTHPHGTVYDQGDNAIVEDLRPALPNGVGFLLE